MKDTDTAVTHDLITVNALVRKDAAMFVQAEEARYEAQISAAARYIADNTHGCQPVMLCGPSSVGKTTSAKKLCRALQERGVQAVMVSLDDFYRGAGLAPRLEDGSFDYESPEALNLPRLHRCMRELMTTGETRLPRYDFTAGAPAKEETLLYTAGDTAVIFEGINAFSEAVAAGFEGTAARPIRVFINTKSRFTKDGEVQLCRRDIRLSRRLLRDERTRNSSFENTMSMWAQVMAGEERYILPYSYTADITVDTTMGYEPCVLAPLILPRLASLKGTAYEAVAQRLKAVYATLDPMDMALLPTDSLLREFLGRQ